ncbi:MAG: 1-(5-phosphoribosyl)-5-[(5-phosphoribosylamino)methylideneamino]imidazole-4-carboxamide isomerase [Woeseiaceae bacterium]|nr:1-(5-phosphoribosyl)-5-[(5-phosphoribosylamino)methylideneamino]imidazole-4-carboxamide isomerase [Woeseiaceae bacterium]NIP20334.1 1-(5-phosphoribosyl)-5-[(5-phosphoribosylamino)methylideneamino]imidazole-4-carboxamide isomerase [Woeseiaceae bacterium]NIS89224.1 1-(5-phosphoribosyl)-5-[(5-phosphoribosylamino)methylideneamino]imidazole-4-carboxamide isomerase [Woeseiaceae bacterium]
MNVIPAIDLKDGKCVRLLKGDFDKVTEYSNDPVAVVQMYADFSTTDLHIVDLDGAQTGTQYNRDVISQIARETDLTVQLGGGIRDQATVAGWLDSGATRCVIGSLAITEPDAVKSWIVQFGSEHIVLALDVQVEDGVPFVTTHGWTTSSTASVFECLEDYLAIGLKHVLCTDVSRDGAMAGPNVSLYRQIMDRFPDIQLQASGGVRDIADLAELRNNKIPAAITGRALLDGRITPEEMVSFQQNA